MSTDYLPPRRAAAADLALLARHRTRMFADMGEPVDAAFEAAARAWLAGVLAQERYLGWLVAPAADADQVVAGGGLLLLDWPPTVTDPGTVRAYLLNVYTEPAHRGRGLARVVTLAALDEARRRGIGVATLHASDEGRRVYQRLGFAAGNEMRLVLR